MFKINGTFTNATVMIDELEESCVKQIESMCNDSAFTNPIVIMPDSHSGKGSVIGFTMPFTDRLNPEIVGVDVGCGVLSVNIGNEHTKRILSNIADIDKNIKRSIPMGMYGNKKVMDSLSVFDIYLDVEYICEKISINTEKEMMKIHSLGSGNHFAEIGIDENNNIWLTIHSGSRHFGLSVANYHTNVMRNGGITKEEKHKLLNINIAKLRQTNSGHALKALIDEAKRVFDSGNPTNYLTGDKLEDYIEDMKVCQRYAEINRALMIDTMINQIERVIKGKCGVIDSVESVHNYINFKDKIIRKGAISAHENEKVVIPFNMRDGLIIGKGKGNPDWNYSAPHGAGRLMSRTKARNSIAMKDYQESMNGIYSSCVNKNTIDESPMAYKDKDVIMGLIYPTVEVITMVKPILNIKAEG